MNTYLQVDILVGIIIALVMFISLWLCYGDSKSSIGKFWRTMAIVFLILLIGWIVFMIINTQAESKILAAQIFAEESENVNEDDKTIYGYCPYSGNSRSDPYGKNCSECSVSVHGCCPNLSILKRDAYGSNCFSKCLECGRYPNQQGLGGDKTMCGKWTYSNNGNKFELCDDACCPPPSQGVSTQSIANTDYIVKGTDLIPTNSQQGNQNMTTSQVMGSQQAFPLRLTNSWDQGYQTIKMSQQLSDVQNTMNQWKTDMAGSICNSQQMGDCQANKFCKWDLTNLACGACDTDDCSGT